VNSRDRIASLWFPLVAAGVAIGIIGGATNLRLAAVASVAAAAILGTRLRYATFAGILLLAVVGCVVVMCAGR
jgi:nitrate/nitrite transporter NarK